MPEAASTRRRDQRRRALQRANKARIAQAMLKKQLRQGAVRIEVIVATPPEQTSSAHVLDLLMAVPKCGPVKAARLLGTARISQSKTLGGLSDRQRARLTELLSR